MTTTVNFDHLLPAGESLFDYQHVGVAYALVATKTDPGKGVAICDEQGLGKTRQGIVTCKAYGAKKILVVCKASLRGNWLAEYQRCAPELSVELLRGPVPYEVSAQVSIIAFDSLSTWADGLVQEGFDALIIDESHYIKSAGSDKNPVQRTRAALKISEEIRRRLGLVILLTGTPVLNRPIELITQLQCIGRLREIAPRPRKNPEDERSWEFAFKFAYCGPTHNGHGYEFKGATNLDNLNDKLRSSCYVRRLRTEVLGFNETSRFEVPLTLNGALDEYFEAENGFLDYLRRNKGAAAVAAAQQAETLVLLNTLRKLAGEAKVEAAVEWIESFLEENPNKKLVVFAWHIEVQKAIAKAVKGIYLGGVKDIEVAKRQFNEGDARVIVCSLQAHREGHTLVGDGHNVTDVLFVENPWHAGAKSQAEDRINRIGQKSDHVFAWTLLAPAAAIDIWLHELVEHKRVVARGAADGRDVAIEDDASIQQLLLERFNEKAVA